MVKNKNFLYAKFKHSSNILTTNANVRTIISELSSNQKGISFKEVFKETDVYGKTHSKYQLFFRGVLLRGGEYVFHSSSFGIDFVNGFMAPITTKIIANDNDNSNVQFGSYYQESCTFYNVYHPSQSGSLNGSSVFLHQGCMTTISLSNMNGRTVTLSGGGTPLYWSYTPAPNTPYATGTLHLQLPYGSGGVPFIFNVSANGSCYSKSLVFFAYSNNSRYGFSISPNPVSDILTITAVENDESTIDQNSKSADVNVMITANISDFNTNQLKISKTMISGNKTYQINVASLKRGYHVLQIIEGNQTHSIKFLKL